MIERLDGRNALPRRQAGEAPADLLLFFHAEDLVAVPSQAARHGHEPGQEQQRPDRGPRRGGEAVDDRFGHRGQREQVAPCHHLRVVPLRRREHHEEEDGEDAKGGDDQQQVLAAPLLRGRHDGPDRKGKEEAEVDREEDERVLLPDQPSRSQPHERRCPARVRELGDAAARRHHGPEERRQRNPHHALRADPHREHQRKEKERVDVEERHHAPEQALDESRQTSFPSQEPPPPAPEQEQPRREREEEPALRDKEGEEQVLPREVRLVILQLPGPEELQAREPAREQEGRDREAAAPGEERQGKRRRPRDPHRRQHEAEGRPQLGEDRREEVDPKRIVQLLPGEDRVVGPEARPLDEVGDVREVQRKVAVVVRVQRTNEAVPLEIEPHEMAEAGHRKHSQGQAVENRH